MGVDSWMGGCHGHLPCQAHVHVHQGIPMELHGGGLLDGWMPWTPAMPSSCACPPGHSHGIAWGWTPGWVDAMDTCHAKLMCMSTRAFPWNCMGVDSWMGGCHGHLPCQAHVH